MTATVAVEHVFEADPVLPYEVYEKIRDRYWVGDLNGRSYWFQWTFSVNEPAKVPNPDMFWRHPTYDEALHREQFYREDPEGWHRLVEEYADPDHRGSWHRSTDRHHFTNNSHPFRRPRPLEAP